MKHGLKDTHNHHPQACSALDKDVDQLESEYLTRFKKNFNPEEKTEFFCGGIELEASIREYYYPRSSKQYLPVNIDGVCFEGNRYDSLQNAEKYLNTLYGDIWKLPNNIYPQHDKEFSDYSQSDDNVLHDILQDDSSTNQV